MGVVHLMDSAIVMMAILGPLVWVVQRIHLATIAIKRVPMT